MIVERFISRCKSLWKENGWCSGRWAVRSQQSPGAGITQGGCAGGLSADGTDSIAVGQLGSCSTVVGFICEICEIQGKCGAGDVGLWCRER